jgi:hypothetical protein
MRCGRNIARGIDIDADISTISIYRCTDISQLGRSTKIRDVNETLHDETETRPRRPKQTSRDRLETETFETETTSLLKITYQVLSLDHTARSDAAQLNSTGQLS